MPAASSLTRLSADRSLGSCILLLEATCYFLNAELRLKNEDVGIRSIYETRVSANSLISRLLPLKNNHSLPQHPPIHQILQGLGSLV